MQKKLLSVLFCTLLIATVILPVSGTSEIDMSQDEEPRRVHGNFLGSDALTPPDISNIKNTPCFGPDPGFYETSEYMIGSVAVGVIFLESNGVTDPSTEDWTTTEENNVKNEIQAALNWWASQNTNAGISFVYDWNYQVPTSIEPITHPSVFTDNSWEQTYVSEAMAHLGYTTGDWMYRTRDYTNDLRTNKGTDWAYAVYVIDSSADADGYFSDYSPPTLYPCAWAYYGIFASMTYDNGKLPVGWGIGRMDQVMAHETGHIFWATDEYNGNSEWSGYLNQQDNEGSGCLMDNCNLCLSSGTKLQIGWRDTDVDTIQDIVDTNPDTTLNAYTPDPTYNTILTYTGSAAVQPYTNSNPQPSNSGNDVTINTISNVQYRVDGGTWTNAQASDGTFDGPTESFTFTTSSLSPGQHTIEARAVNSVGNVDPTPGSDTITIIVNNPPNTPSTPSGPASGNTGVQYTYSTSTTDPDNDNVKYGWDWDGDSTVDEWTVFYSSGVPVNTPHTWGNAGTYYVQVKAEDVNGAQSGFSPALTVVITGASNNPPNTPSTPSGPTSGNTGVQYTYSTSTTDPDNDNVKYGWDFNGDGIVENNHWTGFYSSGATCSVNIQFNGAGTYYLSVMAEDVYGAQSGFSPALTVVITGSNNVPNTPSTPSGPTSGNTGVSYSYSTSTTDPDNDNVKYGWDWNGDNTVDYWTSFYSSGATCSVSNSWSSAGTYRVKVKAEDANGAQSGWSSSLTVVISSGANQPPNKPTLTGPPSGKSGTQYTYESDATDPEQDQIYYWFDWGDGTNSDWLGPYNSGATVSAKHMWNKGTYEIKVKAKDSHDAESEWSDPLSISMPKNKAIDINSLFLRFLENYPNLFPILRYILRL